MGEGSVWGGRGGEGGCVLVEVGNEEMKRREEGKGGERRTVHQPDLTTHNTKGSSTRNNSS